MAKIELGIMGPFRGKCGGVIGYVRNGVACVRSMPAHYRDRRSEVQLRNRGRFTMVMKAMSVVRPVVTLGFGRFATRMTEMNVATRENYYRLVRDGASGMEYAWAGLTLSRGAVGPLEGVLYGVSGRRLSLNWNGLGLDLRGAMDDEVTVVMVNVERMEMRMRRGVARCGAGGAEMVLPMGWDLEEVWCYVMVERGGEWSDSRCVGQVCGRGMMTVAVEPMGDTEGDGLEVASTDCGGTEVCFCSDQSAIGVLPELEERRRKRVVELLI